MADGLHVAHMLTFILSQAEVFKKSSCCILCPVRGLTNTQYLLLRMVG